MIGIVHLSYMETGKVLMVINQFIHNNLMGKTGWPYKKHH